MYSACVYKWMTVPKYKNIYFNTQFHTNNVAKQIYTPREQEENAYNGKRMRLPWIGKTNRVFNETSRHRFESWIQIQGLIFSFLHLDFDNKY